MNLSVKIALIAKDCVACGCCIAVCPKSALRIHMGISAMVDTEKCIGCGICAGNCPAAAISIAERRSVV